MGNKRRSRVWIALIAVLALGIAACGNGDDTAADDDGDEAEPLLDDADDGDEGLDEDADDEGPEDTDADDEGTDDGDETADADSAIDVWIMVPGNEEVENVLQEMGDSFEEENPEAAVNIEFIPWDDAHDQFVTGVLGGQTPDLAEMGNTWTAEFVDLGGLAPIEADTDGYVDGLVESALVDDTLYGYPWYAGARALVYRSDVFEDLGLDAPETWDDVLEAGDVIADETDMDPIHVAGEYTHQVAPQVWQAGGELAETEGDGWAGTVDSEAGVAAFQFYADMWDRGWSPEGAVNWNSVDVRDAFANEESAMMIGGGWDLSAAMADNPDLEGNVGTTLTPAGPDGSHDAFAGGSHLVAFEDSENIELAHQFAEYLLEPDNVTEFTERIGFLPGTEEGIAASSAEGDELYGTFADQMIDHSRGYPPAPEWGQIEGELLIPNVTQRLLLGEVDAEGAAAELNEEMNAAFGN